MEKTKSPPNPYRLKKILRRIVLAIGLFCLLFFYFQFDTYRIGADEWALAPEYPPGRLLLYDRFTFYHLGLWPVWTGKSQNMGRHNLAVFWVSSAYNQSGETLKVGKVLALPGESLKTHPLGIQVGAVPYPLPPEVALSFSAEVLGGDEYLLLYQEPAGQSVLGIVYRKNIAGKVVLAW